MAVYQSKLLRAVSVASDAKQTLSEELDDYLKAIESMVNIDSGVDTPEGILAVQEFLAAIVENLGFRTQWERTGDISHFKARLEGSGEKVVLLGHADTVFQRGTTRQRPFRVEGQTAYGPGVVDMKGGLATAVAAVKCLEVDSIPDRAGLLAGTIIALMDSFQSV
jgi:glutamate carboxypeptidase